MFPSATSLQNAGNIQIGTGLAPQPNQTPNIQPSGNILAAPADTFTPPAAAPAVQPTFAGLNGQQYGSAAAAAQSYAPNIDNQTAIIQNQARSNATSAQNQYNNSAMNVADTFRSGVQNVNAARQNIALGQLQSTHNLINTIRQGLQSGAVSLGNSNALGSSAANVLARLANNYGNQQRAGINTEAAQKYGQQDIALNNLNTQQMEGMRNLQTTRDQFVQQISDTAHNQLLALDQYANSVGLGGHVQIEGIKQGIINDATSRLSGIDQWLQGQLAGIAPQSRDQVVASANQLLEQGASGTPFSIQDTGVSGAPPTAEFGGADISQLPLFVRPRTA